MGLARAPPGYDSHWLDQQRIRHMIDLIFLVVVTVLVSFRLLSYAVSSFRDRRNRKFEELRNRNAAMYPGVFNRTPPEIHELQNIELVNVYDERLRVKLGTTRAQNILNLVRLFAGSEAELHPVGSNDIPFVNEDAQFIRAKHRSLIDSDFLEMLEQGIHANDAGVVIIRWLPHD